ncbi:Tryptophan synthase beta subunit-like PLP-dependent enzymes superfamily [Penicillium riverlandense]|uniref:Tryptophan synthase beta subunit-like PLP-dependent enzymes superfamily n=1 Tax=Penicillium riverlandense TaxID=1903569 RepID=UPI002547AF01|nr:Tryptophan synthase beta subunit-like PLP-dependent enzymes superfamily [Penicillium riverlandense]KAJ5831979.1 Tryptophan synthase beta subunit-like PLP-dependent enzymes superfamily [Penicillium riverlandense]
MIMAVVLPEIFAQIPRYPLLYNHSSPIHSLPRTSQRATSTTPRLALFAKREDQSSPLACAGNKYRKLEYIIPDILSVSPQHHDHEHAETPTPSPGAATTLVTEGAVQSNHTVQVSALARQLGLNALVLLQKGTGAGFRNARDPDAFLRSGNVQINRMLGAEVRVLDEGDPLSRDARPVLDALRARGQRPYWIPGGASMHALGGLGYARAAMEIAVQEKELRLGGSGRFDYVFVACGSGSTVGGLVAGFKLYEKMRTSSSSTASSSSATTTANAAPPRQIIGVLNSPTNPKPYHEARVLAFARRAGALIGLDPETDLGVEDVRLDDRFVGTGYGVLDAEAREALETMARTEGVILDPVYTAKVARGMLHWVQQGEVVADARRNGHHSDEVNVLFIHTGGQAALGAYADVI